MSNVNSGPSSSSNNWRNPSLAHQQKYNIRPVPEGFAPTPEEQQLLDMYEVMRSHERLAARIKEEAARAKLLARNAEFQQQKLANTTADQRRSNKRTRKGTSVAENNDDDDDDDLDDISEGNDDDDDVEYEDFEEKTLHDRREEKLAELREQVEEKKNAINQVDALREKLLMVTETMDDEPMLKKKRKDIAMRDSNLAGPSSLIANLGGTVTPPQDFSEKLGLTRGTVLFPTVSGEFHWMPPEGVYAPNDGAFQVQLNDFDIARAQNGSGNNTVAIKCTIPEDSKRFSINIVGPEHDDFASVLCHFNPRQRERGGQVIVNDKKDGIWGNALAIPLSQFPLMFGQTACTIMIQINGEGFDIFVENIHCARLEHRSELPVGSTNLVLQFPSTDDYGVPESWTVYKVWWGLRPILAKGDVSGIPGVNSFSSDHPRKVFISGLDRIHSDAEVELRRAELERAFKKYGSDRGVQVIVPTNKTYAFVEMESESMTDLALRELCDRYLMNRARRSRHEALREERAAAEAMKLGATNANNAWD